MDGVCSIGVGRTDAHGACFCKNLLHLNSKGVKVLRAQEFALCKLHAWIQGNELACHTLTVDEVDVELRRDVDLCVYRAHMAMAATCIMVVVHAPRRCAPQQP